MKEREVVIDFVNKIDTAKIPVIHVVKIKLIHANGTMTVLTGSEKDKFVQNYTDRIGRNYREVRYVIDAEGMVNELMKVISDVWQTVDRMQEGRHK